MQVAKSEQQCLPCAFRRRIIPRGGRGKQKWNWFSALIEDRTLCTVAFRKPALDKCLEVSEGYPRRGERLGDALHDGAKPALCRPNFQGPALRR